MNEQFLRVGEVELCYEVLGHQVLGAGRSDAQPTVLLVMGLGLQLVWWRDEFCADLVARGFRVVRFDNRDVGRSSRIPGPGIGALQFLRRRARPVYSLADMADDAAGLVAPGGVHVVGVSLGSGIAQELAVRYPDRVLSLVSVMARPGDARSGRTSPRMTLAFLRPAPRSPAAAVEHMVRAFDRIGSVNRSQQDEDDVREAMRRSAGRSDDESGSGRQLAAIVAERDRTEDLRGLQTPALVLHGTRDRIIRPSGGEATAAAIPGAELVLIEGMGHDLPRWVWPELIDGIARTARRQGT